MASSRRHSDNGIPCLLQSAPLHLPVWSSMSTRTLVMPPNLRHEQCGGGAMSRDHAAVGKGCVQPRFIASSFQYARVPDPSLLQVKLQSVQWQPVNARLQAQGSHVQPTTHTHTHTHRPASCWPHHQPLAVSQRPTLQTSHTATACPHPPASP